MLPDLQNLELPALYDLLADYTSKYTLMMRWGGISDGYEECKNVIQQLQSEIDSRNSQVNTQETNDLDDGMELAPTIA
jgi:hypothetical protein